MKLIKFENFKINEDDGGGCAMSSGGNGMGAVVSAQPSAIPGSVAGSTIGSGDIGYALGSYTKYPVISKKKKRKKSKMHNIVEFSKFECQSIEYKRYGNSVKDECTVHCLDCGMEIENDMKSKKAHVYSKHWVHPTRNDEEANKLVDKLFPKE